VARARATRLGVEVELRRADAQELPFPDERFDSVVFSLVLCTVPDDALAVAEARRVLRPGGRLLSLEHVRSPNPVIRFGQTVANPFSRRFGADQLLRDPLDPVTAAGFQVEELRRSSFGFVEALSARKPAREDRRA
jgi:SAM-dependent methyltransferase